MPITRGNPDYSTIQRCLTLARKECCNYMGGSYVETGGSCHLIADYPSIHDGALGCDWFLAAILPLDQELWKIIRHEIGKEEQSRQKPACRWKLILRSGRRWSLIPAGRTLVGVINVFKDCARRNAAAWSELFAKRPDLHDDWIAAGAISEQRIIAARQEIIAAANGDLMGAYDTITRGLFKYPSETSFKRFYWQVFGDLAADVIRANLETQETSIA